jgi:hypothetical protein
MTAVEFFVHELKRVFPTGMYYYPEFNNILVSAIKREKIQSQDYMFHCMNRKSNGSPVETFDIWEFKQSLNQNKMTKEQLEIGRNLVTTISRHQQTLNKLYETLKYFEGTPLEFHQVSSAMGRFNVSKDDIIKSIKVDIQRYEELLNDLEKEFDEM